VYGVAISRGNDRFVSCGGDRVVVLWDVSGVRAIRRFTGHEHRVNAVVLNADASVAISAGYDKTVRCWDLRSSSRAPVQVLTDAADSVSSLHVHDTRIMAGSVDGCVRIYDVRAAALATHTVGPPVTCAVMSRDGNCALACSLDDRLRLLDLTSGQVLATYGGAAAPGAQRGYKGSNYKLEASLSSDDAHVLAGSEDGSVHVWDLVSAEERGMLKGHTAPVCALDYHPSPSTHAMVTGSHDGSARFWVQ